MREVLSDAGNLEKNNQPYREKLQYEAIMGLRSRPKIKSSEREPLLLKEKQEV